MTGPFTELLGGPPRGWERPRLFAWEAPNACGVTDRQDSALDGVREALHQAPPGAVAEIRRVTVNHTGDLLYIDTGPTVTASIDPATGVLVWFAA